MNSLLLQLNLENKLNIMKLIYLFILAFIVLNSCSENIEKSEPHPFDIAEEVNTNLKKKVVNLYELSWIQGLWIDSTSFPNNIVVEHWLLTNDTLIGKRGTVKGKDTTFSQTSKIFINNDSPVYLLEAEGSAFVSFSLKEITKNSVTFGNGANLAPTELTYSKKGNNLGLEFIIITQVGERKFNHVFLPLQN